MPGTPLWTKGGGAEAGQRTVDPAHGKDRGSEDSGVSPSRATVYEDNLRISKKVVREMSSTMEIREKEFEDQRMQYSELYDEYLRVVSKAKF